MTISYAITVCNEHEELDRLLTSLFDSKRDEDEVVLQYDEGNTTPEVFKVIGKFENKKKFRIFGCSLEGDFASFKNNLKDGCIGEWIFQIDADEIPHKSLIKNIHLILEANPQNEVVMVPRINTVEGLTQQHINEWKWRVDDNGWVNFPDWQTRIFQNSQSIKWVGKVHEAIHGHQNYGFLPTSEEWCLYHPKEIKRQEVQNKFYDTL